MTAVAALLLIGCSGKTPQGLGMKDGQFSPCPESPNCVSSQAADTVHHVSPIQAHGSPDVVMVDLAESIESIYGGKVVAVEGTYLRAEFTSRVFRFVDDFECFYDEARGVIEVRSASRLGYSDFNVNKSRVEELRKAFKAKRDG
jgi:uncharacterized protein (DUF1499 family)